MAKLSGITTPSLTFDEGAAPSTPAANDVILYAKSDGLLYSKDDAGAETLVSGSAAPAAKYAHVYRTTTQSISNTTFTVIGFDAEVVDGDGMHDNSTNNSRLTVVTAGVWVFGGCFGYDTNTTGQRQWIFRVNGSTLYAMARRGAPGTGGFNNAEVVTTPPLPLVATDYVEFGTYQDSGGSRTVSSTDPRPEFWAYRIGT